MIKKFPTLALLGILLLAGTSYATDLGLSESIIDFGTVQEGPPVIKTVILTNNGTESLALAKATAS